LEPSKLIDWYTFSDGFDRYKFMKPLNRSASYSLK